MRNHWCVLVCSLALAGGAACKPDIECPEGLVPMGDSCVDAGSTPGGDGAAPMPDGGLAGETADGGHDGGGGSPSDGGCTPRTWYGDQDGDGYGHPRDVAEECAAPEGYVEIGGDCDDDDARVHPVADELCDARDNDCDDEVDEEVVTGTYYRDSDGEGHGQPGASMETCAPPADYVGDGDDCDDGDATVHPGADEVCNGTDDDCDASVDEDVESTFHRDADGDGYGDSASTTRACSAPTGYVTDATDCDDGRGTTHPGAAEVCNGIDDDCDTSVDEGVKSTFHRDADGDGYGDPASTTRACTAPSGYVTDASDCNDAASSAHPGGTEVCNTVDDDCDGSTDEGEIGPWWYLDCDDDGMAAGTGGRQRACSEPEARVWCPGGWTDLPPADASSTDCKDDDDRVYPGQTAFFSAPIEASDWDYDCSGHAERQYTTVNQTWCPSSCGIAIHGWTDSAVPDCGESATLRSCTLSFSGCASNSRPHTQRCR